MEFTSVKIFCNGSFRAAEVVCRNPSPFGIKSIQKPSSEPSKKLSCHHPYDDLTVVCLDKWISLGVLATGCLMLKYAK